MIASVGDFLFALKSLLPAGWYPNSGAASGTPQSATPTLDAVLTGPATVDAQVYQLATYAALQTLLSTATDGILDIKVADYLGQTLLRLSGESDPAYQARALANLLPKANTRPNIQTALESLTGNPVRMIEPWDPRDTGVYDGPDSYYDIDTPATPARYTNPAERYQGFIECTLPSIPGPGAAPSDATYDGIAYYDENGWYWDAVAAPEGGATLVYALINRLKVKGTLVWVKFVAPPGVDDPFTLPTSVLGGPDILSF